jgi:hypothetical protein
MTMIAITTDSRPVAGLFQFLRSRGLWCALAVTLIGLRSWLSDPTALTVSLGDTDDATRLTQVRELMAGAPWYDLTLSRFGGSMPLVSHWSRLIDAPIALIIGTAGLVMSASGAEMAARVLWPSLVLLAFLRLLVREAEIRIGETGAILLLVYGVTCLSGLSQFSLGRIDHHNAMIFGAVGGLVMLARAFETPRVGWAAGLLLGVSLSIGYEPLALVLPGVAVAVVLALWTPQRLEAVRNTVTGLAITLAIALVLTVAPSRWLKVTCDALALNLVLFAVTGAAGLWYLHRAQARLTLWSRFGVMAVAGVTGLAIYAGVEPVCLGGPFAQVDPAVGPVWLNQV